MDVKKFEVYHTTIQNQNPCPEIELKNVFYLRLQVQALWDQFIIKPKGKMNSKLISLLFSCRVTRTVHIELISTHYPRYYQEFKEILIRGKPKTVYSDNARTFKSGAK